MPDTDGVLAAIDACLEDIDVSHDAMRWAPNEPDPIPGQYWHPLEQKWLVWPEGACPSCRRCIVHWYERPVRNGQPSGPATITYMCGYQERK